MILTTAQLVFSGVYFLLAAIGLYVLVGLTYAFISNQFKRRRADSVFWNSDADITQCKAYDKFFNQDEFDTKR